MERKVLYLVGAQNSGSTMLDVMLGQFPRVFGLGEVGRIFDIRGDAHCNCGAVVNECDACYGLLSRLDRCGQSQQLRREFPKLLKEKSFLKVRFLGAYQDYTTVSDTIFDAIFDCTGAAVLVDSSKNVSRAVALQRGSRHDVYFLHLIRDGRGYVRSRNSEKRLRRLGGRPRFVYNIWKWLLKNALATVALRSLRGVRYKLLRYEDLVRDPEGVVKDILEFVGESALASDSVLSDRRALSSRKQIYETPRQVSYSTIKIDSSRLADQRYGVMGNIRYIAMGGIFGLVWGYGVKADYLDGLDVNKGPSSRGER